MNISKSQYIRGLQCHKSLWLYKYHPELREEPDATQEALFNTGYSVGEIAKDLFPNGVEIEFDPDNFKGMIEKTKELILNGVDVIYEATFCVDGIFVMVDILVKRNELWEMYEVKASTSVKQYHLNDISMQWYVVNQVIPLSKAFIIHVDNTYIRSGCLDIHSLLKIEDVTDIVLDMQDKIESNLLEMQHMLNGDVPEIDIGTQCDDPFSCDYKKYCWQHIPKPSIFNLYWMNSSKKFEMYYSGIINYTDITSNFKLNAVQDLQVNTVLSQKPHINTSIIKDFLDTIEYPINFFDFETFQNAIPRFDNQRPYMQIPFQYSLHILHEDGTLDHKEFLGDEHSDPREPLIIQMLKDITPTGSIVAYNQGFEIGRIKELAEFDEPKSKELLKLNKRFIDLIDPFRNRGYYHPDFNGSFSIKSVLPAMFPNDDELDYKKLEIQNGGMAMETFANLHLLKDVSLRDKIRKDLLAYCHLDTLAMVRIWEKLHNIIKVSDRTV